MIKFSETPIAKKLHKKNPNKVFLILIALVKNGGFLKKCIIDSKSNYWKVDRYENYLSLSIMKLNILMPLEKFEALKEMIKVDVDEKILSNYIFNNLFIEKNN